MISIKNYFQHTAPSVKKIGLALRVLIGSIAGSAFIQGNVKWAFYTTLAGGIIDFILQCLPPGEPTVTAAASPSGNDGTNKAMMATIIAICCLLISSCTVVRPGANVVKTDSTYTTYKHVDFHIKGATVFKTLNVDSLVKAALIARDQYREDSLANAAVIAKYRADSITAVKANKPIPAAPVLITPKPVVQYVTDPQTKAQLSYWIDQAGKIQIGCQSKDQTIDTLQAQITTLKSNVTTNTVTVPQTPLWAKIVMWAEGIVALICIVILFIKSIL